MENLSANDSLLQADIANRNYQNYSPSTSCSLSTSGSVYSLSSSPNSINSYGVAHESPCNGNRSMPSTPPSCKRRGSEPVISQYTHHYHRSQNSPEYLNSSMSDENNASVRCDAEINCARPLNRFFPDGVVDILNKWFYENQNYPYPDENMTNILAKEANISAKQVRKWFANKRVRSNKCYKQTFRIRKDLQKVHINRRQTKSVSDGESLHTSQLNYYDDAFEDDNKQHMSPDMNTVKYIWNHSDHMSTGSSASNSPPSYNIYNSPIVKAEPSTFYQQQQHQSPTGMSHSYSLNSFEQLQQSAASGQNNMAALYNPLFLMNILQNPSMALQAVLANRLISLNNNNSESTNDQVNDLSHSIQSTPIQKRKTHLSNRFHSESYNSKAPTSNLHLIREVPNDNVSHHINSVKSEATNGSLQQNTCHQGMNISNLRDLLIAKSTNQNDSTCSNKSSVRSSFSLDELSTSINSTHLNQSFTNQSAAHTNTNESPVAVKQEPVKKINFGDISSLI